MNSDHENNCNEGAVGRARPSSFASSVVQAEPTSEFATPTIANDGGNKQKRQQKNGRGVDLQQAFDESIDPCSPPPVLNATSDTAMTGNDVGESIDHPSPTKVDEPIAKPVCRCRKTRTLDQGPHNIETIREVSTYRERWMPLLNGETLRLNGLNFIKGTEKEDLRIRKYLLKNNLKSYYSRLKRKANTNIGEVERAGMDSSFEENETLPQDERTLKGHAVQTNNAVNDLIDQGEYKGESNSGMDGLFDNENDDNSKASGDTDDYNQLCIQIGALVEGYRKCRRENKRLKTENMDLKTENMDLRYRLNDQSNVHHVDEHTPYSFAQKYA